MIRRVLLSLLVVLPTVYALGCGPIALAIEGGTAGGLLAFQKKPEEKKSNNPPLTIITSLTREESPATITYRLLDPESNPCSVIIQYRVGAGAFADCTAGLGGDGTSALASSPGGVTHTFEWDFVADLGSTAFTTGIAIRIAGHDGKQGGFAELGGLAIGNDAPVVSAISSSESAGLFLVQFTLADSSADIASMNVEFSTDQAQSWNDLSPTGADFFGNPPTNILTSSGGLPGQFIWNSPAALPNFDGDVFLRLVPSDLPSGYASITEGAAVVHGPIHVKNTANTPPRMNLLSPLTGNVDSSEVRLEFTLSDDQSNPGEVFVEWSLNGTTYNAATLSNQTLQGVGGPFVTTPSPTRYELVWEALADFQAATANNIFLRLTPRDAVSAAPQVFGPLTVFGNRPPEVTAISVTGNSGLVQVNIRIVDSSADRVSIGVEMLIGGTPTVLNSGVLGGADLTNMRASPTGEDNVLVWDTSASLPGQNQSDVMLRVTPVDMPASAPTAALTGAAFTSAGFPIVNNPGAPVPTQVIVSAGGATTVQFGSFIFISSQVLPVPSNQTVNWSVVEGPAYGFIQFLGFPFNSWAYFAPPSPPAAFRPYVTLRAASAINPNVSGTLRLYWGIPPSGVIVSPAGRTVLLGDSLQMSALVNAGGAPQTVSWRVVEGPVAGSIDANGLYRAPLSMPGSNTVTIRATAVNGVAGNTTVTLAPRPNRVVVSATGGATTLALDATLQFSAQVNPFPDTVQAVRWRVVFDGEDRGSGDSTVGRIDAAGLYTAPHFLPRPIKVQIEASSTVLGAISGRYTITLIAPLPTSFDLTPSTATMIAGGKGQQFTLANLLPDNASSAVVWTRSPALGTIDTEGRYAPPATLAAQTVVLVTATSAVSGSVLAQASITLTPQTGAIPVSVTILPNTASVPAGGAPVQFLATVNPAGAPQAVSWRVVSGGGTITASGGLYTPPATTIDSQVILRATSDANGSAFSEYVLCITGSGSAWTEISATAISRDQPSGFFDAINNYFWIIGGKSEASGARHDTSTFAYDVTTNQWLRFADVGNAAHHNTISAVLDGDNERIIAVVGDDIAAARLFALDLNAPASGWSALAPGGASNAPTLPANFRYLTFWDPGTASSGDERMFVVKDGSPSHAVYTLNTASDAWLAPITLPVTATPGSGIPTAPHQCTYVYNSVRNRHYIFGEPGEISPSLGLYTWQIVTGAFGFIPQAQTGSLPPGFLNNAQAAFDATNNIALVFGGDRASAGFSGNFFTLNLENLGQAAWLPITLSGEQVAARAGGAMATVGTRALMFGGADADGAYGDLWDFSLVDLITLLRVTAAGLSPIDFVPQGRRWPAGCWVTSVDEAYFYGGLTAHGESGELWTMAYNSGTVSWSKVTPAGVVPPACAGANLVHDAARNRLLLFGGFFGGSVFADVYAFDLTSRQWSLLAPSGTAPSGRWYSAAVMDGNRLFIYGGKTDAAFGDFTTGLAGDVHVLDFSTSADGVWGQPAVVAPTVPDARMGAFAGFDAVNSRLFIHGGYTLASQASRQLYALDLGSGIWSVPGVTNSGFQAGVFNCAAAFVPSCARFVSAPAGIPQAQSLVLGAPKATWQTLTSASGPHASGACGLFDAATNRFFVAFGNARQYGADAGTNRVSVIEFE